MRGTVLSLCDKTGIMVEPWLEAGYWAVTVDLQSVAWTHPRREHIQENVREYARREGNPWPEYVAVFAFPPCTDLAVSGARWFRDKGLKSLIEALEIVEACRVICEAKAKNGCWALENPISTLSTYWREPNYRFNPNDYGDPYTKETCLWTGRGFVMPPIIRPGDMFHEPTWVEPTEGSKMHLLPPSPDRADLRSETPMGFARAVFEANAPHLKEAAA